MSDYLFDKEGADADVEALETSLRGLKFDAAPPTLPDDYLFDQVGDDPQVEALESSLQGLRFDQPPPALPDAVVLPMPETRRAPPRPLVRRTASAPAMPLGRFAALKFPLVAALSIGVFAGMISFAALKYEQRRQSPGWKLVPVLVANSDMPEGTELTADMVTQRAIPDQFVTNSVVRPEAATYVMHQKLLVPLQKGDAVLWSQFEAGRTAQRLSQQVNKRARALKIDAPLSPAVAAVRPNDRVDVVGSFKDPLTGRTLTVTLMQNVQVLTTGVGSPHANAEPLEPFSQVSLMVAPEEAELLTLAQQIGAVRVQPQLDEAPTAMKQGRATIDTLVSEEKARAVEERRTQTIRVLRGQD